MFEERRYNKPSLISYEGKLVKKRNKNPEVDSKFLEWCGNNSLIFSSYADMGKALGLDGRCFKKLMERNGIVLQFNPGAPRTPKPYQNYEWLYYELIELNKSNAQVAEENGWTKRVVSKWADIFRLNTVCYKELKKPSFLQREVIIGSILGDGHIAKNSSFIISHVDSQKDYLFWKYEILKSLCSSPPVYYKESIKVIGGKPCHCQGYYRFNTRLISELKEVNNRPVVELIQNLTELQFSIWMLDDGSREPFRWQLCLAPYTEEEREAVIIKMQEWGMSPHFHSSDIRYLDFQTHDTRQVDDIILRHLPESLDIIQTKIIEKRR